MVFVMNMKEIKSLAQILNQSGLTAIEVSEGDSKIRLEKNITAPAAAFVAAPAVLPGAPPLAGTEESVAAKTDAVVDFNKMNEVKSPMVGLFYRAPSPDSAPFVEVGSKVKKGDVLCIIEAMKLMNEIVAECDGEIVDICAENGQLVEFSQILFKIF